MQILHPSFSASGEPGCELCILVFLHPSGGAFWGLPGLVLGSSWLLLISFWAVSHSSQLSLVPLGLSCGSPSPRLWSLRCSIRLWLCRSLALGGPPLCHGLPATPHFCCRLFERLRGHGIFVVFVSLCWLFFLVRCETATKQIRERVRCCLFFCLRFLRLY